ncbi:MAG: HAD hydrolase family protein, partial [Pollutimonas bauzanensis]
GTVVFPAAEHKFFLTADPRERTRRRLRELAEQLGAGAEQIIAVGDGANDLKMMALARYSVAYRAKPVVRRQANYALDVSPLDGILNWFRLSH